VNIKEFLNKLDSEYAISSDFIGNGCEHGFKPASSCPNLKCEKRILHRAFNFFMM